MKLSTTSWGSAPEVDVEGAVVGERGAERPEEPAETVVDLDVTVRVSSRSAPTSWERDSWPVEKLVRCSHALAKVTEPQRPVPRTKTWRGAARVAV